jgi:vacuolar-type H+-ATPase catalytic subunit A/Vma1
MPEAVWDTCIYNCVTIAKYKIEYGHHIESKTITKSHKTWMSNLLSRINRHFNEMLLNDENYDKLVNGLAISFH